MQMMVSNQNTKRLKPGLTVTRTTAGLIPKGTQQDLKVLSTLSIGFFCSSSVFRDSPEQNAANNKKQNDIHSKSDIKGRLEITSWCCLSCNI